MLVVVLNTDGTPDNAVCSMQSRGGFFVSAVELPRALLCSTLGGNIIAVYALIWRPSDPYILTDTQSGIHSPEAHLLEPAAGMYDTFVRCSMLPGVCLL